MKYTGLETLEGIITELEKSYLKKDDAAVYSIQKQEVAQEGYALTYQLTRNGEPVGDPINFMKDTFLKSAEVKSCTQENVPVEGCKVGDKYIDLLVATADSVGAGTHLYLLLDDMVKPASPGAGIALSEENEISVKVDETSANGLYISEDGIALALATKKNAGAMAAKDKAKLDELEFEEITAEEVRAMFLAAGTGGGVQ